MKSHRRGEMSRPTHSRPRRAQVTGITMEANFSSLAAGAGSSDREGDQEQQTQREQREGV